MIHNDDQQHRPVNFKKIFSSIDWKLLSFLILFLNVKLVIKIPAIILIYLLQFNFRFGFKLKNSRLPLFYPLIIAMAFIGLLLNQNLAPIILLFFSRRRLLGIVPAGGTHQIKLSVEENSIERLHGTILIFFIINAIISIYTHRAYHMGDKRYQPYRYQGEYQKYFLGTGDYIKGVTFDISTTNAVLNAFGVVYFLTRKNAVMMLVCMVVLLLTASNFLI